MDRIELERGSCQQAHWKKDADTIAYCQIVILSPVQEFAIACSLQRHMPKQPEVFKSSHNLPQRELCLFALQQHVQQSLLAYCFRC